MHQMTKSQSLQSKWREGLHYTTRYDKVHICSLGSITAERIFSLFHNVVPSCKLVLMLMSHVPGPS